MNSPETDDLSGAEALLRQRLHQLADYAPHTVVYSDEVRLAAAAPARQPRRRWLTFGVPVFALLAAGGITAVASTGQGQPGAATPQEAVRHLADAVDQSDVLGALDTLLPDEVSALRLSIEQTKTEATRVGLLDQKLSLSGIDGLSFKSDNLQFATEELGTGLAIVRATGGTLTSTFDATKFPLGGPLRSALPASGSSLSTGVKDFSSAKTYLATVQRDGRWYVSLTYTLAEFWRRQGHDNVPPTPIATAEGFDSPEAAATAFYQRLVAVDLTGLVATAAPGEGEALARYAPLWIPRADATIADARAQGLALTLDGLTTEVTGSGSFRTVNPTAYHVSGTTPGTWFDYSQVSSSYLPFDPTLPTVIFSQIGNDTYLVSAGEPLPTTIAGLTPMGPDEWPSAGSNNLTALADGTVVPPPDAASPAAPPGPLTIDIAHADGCSTLTGTLADRLAQNGWPGRVSPGISAASNTEVGDVKLCDNSGQMIGGALSLLLGGGIPSGLPEVATVQHGDKWYISPIGTIFNQLTGVLRSIKDNDVGLDSPLAFYVYGTNRAQLTQQLMSLSSPVPAACQPITEVDSNGIFLKLADHPDASKVRECVAIMNGGGQSSAYDANGNPVGPAGAVVATAAEPASTAFPVIEPSATAFATIPQIPGTDAAAIPDPASTTALANPQPTTAEPATTGP